MIYQCFYREQQRPRLFNTECYQGFGLEPKLNPTLFSNCPELEIQANRKTLNEYACFLWFFRNQSSLDSHFGTTSFRQLSKSKSVFKDINKLKDNCGTSNIVTWNLSKNLDSSGYPIPVSLATEVFHPYLNSYISFVFDRFGYEIPEKWYSQSECIYANYWYVSKSLFIDFMEYSFPIINFCLDTFKECDHPYFSSQRELDQKPNPFSRRIGFLAERLFIIWYFSKNLKVVNLGKLHTMKSDKFSFYKLRV